MYCFRIPKSICEEIEKACANFWWGEEVGRKKLHWKSWKALCRPKCMGGLGFRHLETFTKNLLAKKIWRIIVKPQFLVARVLKARYFRHQDIMDASLGSNPSYIWRYIMWSRSIMEKGLLWHVGNGEHISTFDNRWIPGGGFLAPTLSDRAEYGTVNTLITNGRWNDQIVNTIFQPHIASNILSIPLSASRRVDFRYWFIDSKGKYSVKEGYKVEIGLYDSPSHSSTLPLKDWWKFL
ncbi:putative mitochondrial protein AtMg00310 [Primulina tabacum]|uniref:putative mitochondrial protein AtMg00310 n=1 Tax=Primulina tabacum TaxID=48773 RepID=UPI003F593430